MSSLQPQSAPGNPLLAPALRLAVPEAGEQPIVQAIIDAHLSLTGGECCPRREEERCRVLGMFARDFGHLLASQLRPLDLLQWLQGHKEWVSGWTRKSVLGIVERAFNWAVAMQLVPNNPVRGVRVEKGQPQRPMENREFRKLYQKADRRFRRVLAFLRWTGCRPGEMSSMTWGDVNLERGVVVLRKHKTMKKTGKPRVLYLPPEAVKLLTTMKNGRRFKKAVCVFRNRAGRPWNRCSLSLRLQRLRRRAGVATDAKLYGLRHKFAVAAIRNNVNLRVLASLMGHSNVNTTLHYLTYVDSQTDVLTEAAAQAVRRTHIALPTDPAPDEAA